MKDLIVKHSDSAKFEQYTQMRNQFIIDNPDVKFGFEYPSANSSPMRSVMLDSSPMVDGPSSHPNPSQSDIDTNLTFSTLKDSQMPAGS